MKKRQMVRCVMRAILREFPLTPRLYFRVSFTNFIFLNTQLPVKSVRSPPQLIYPLPGSTTNQMEGWVKIR